MDTETDEKSWIVCNKHKFANLKGLIFLGGLKSVTELLYLNSLSYIP